MILLSFFSHSLTGNYPVTGAVGIWRRVGNSLAPEHQPEKEGSSRFVDQNRGYSFC